MLCYEMVWVNCPPSLYHVLSTIEIIIIYIYLYIMYISFLSCYVMKYTFMSLLDIM